MTRNSNEEVLKSIINSNKEKQYKELKDNWTKRIKKSNELIELVEKDPQYLSHHYKEIFDEIEMLNNALDYYAELGIDEDEIGYAKYGLREVRRNLEKNYRTLSIRYYNYMTKDVISRATGVSKKQSSLAKKLIDTDSKIESLGSTFLNIVLTISIVSSMVAVLVHVPAEYAISVGLLCAWLLLSSILFISEYFKNNVFVKRESFARKIYIALSIVTLISFIAPSVVKKINNYTCDDLVQKVYIIDNQNDMKYRLIDDSVIINDFVDSFHTYWESHDSNFSKYKYLLENDGVMSIVIYNYVVNNSNVYRCELFFLNGKTVSFNTNSDSLEEWLISKGISVW